jgi:hypothetical protein
MRRVDTFDDGAIKELAAKRSDEDSANTNVIGRFAKFAPAFVVNVDRISAVLY